MVDPKQGAIRANDTDYGGSVVVELLDYWPIYGGDLGWAVPAWDERGEPDLDGPFSTVAEAQAAIEAAQ